MCVCVYVGGCVCVCMSVLVSARTHLLMYAYESYETSAAPDEAPTALPNSSAAVLLHCWPDTGSGCRVSQALGEKPGCVFSWKMLQQSVDKFRLYT